VSQVHVTVPMAKRMQALRNVGLSIRAVAAVVALDFDTVQPSAKTVRKYTTSPHYAGLFGLSHGDIGNWKGRNGS
jgi:hypothetical protein